MADDAMVTAAPQVLDDHELLTIMAFFNLIVLYYKDGGCVGAPCTLTKEWSKIQES